MEDLTFADKLDILKKIATVRKSWRHDEKTQSISYHASLSGARIIDLGLRQAYTQAAANPENYTYEKLPSPRPQSAFPKPDEKWILNPDIAEQFKGAIVKATAQSDTPEDSVNKLFEAATAEGTVIRIDSVARDYSWGGSGDYPVTSYYRYQPEKAEWEATKLPELSERMPRTQGVRESAYENILSF